MSANTVTSIEIPASIQPEALLSSGNLHRFGEGEATSRLAIEFNSSEHAGTVLEWGTYDDTATKNREILVRTVTEGRNNTFYVTGTTVVSLTESNENNELRGVHLAQLDDLPTVELGSEWVVDGERCGTVTGVMIGRGKGSGQSHTELPLKSSDPFARAQTNIARLEKESGAQSATSTNVKSSSPVRERAKQVLSKSARLGRGAVRAVLDAYTPVISSPQATAETPAAIADKSPKENDPLWARTRSTAKKAIAEIRTSYAIATKQVRPYRRQPRVVQPRFERTKTALPAVLGLGQTALARVNVALTNGQGRVGEVLGKTLANARGAVDGSEYLEDEERGKIRRRALYMGMGVLAITATAYAANKGWLDAVHVLEGGEEAIQPADVPVPESPATAVEPMAPVIEVPQPLTVPLPKNGNIWNLAAEHLHGQGIADPTNAQIDALKDQLLQINGISEEQAAHLPEGFSVRFP